MKYSLLALTFLIIFSCSNKKEVASVNDFQRYLNSLDNLNAPLVFRSNSQLENLSIKADTGLFRKFKSDFAIRPYGRLFKTDSIVVTINVTTGDIVDGSIFNPTIIIFDSVGNKLDEMKLYKTAGKYAGYESDELVSINNKREIITVRSLRRWDLNKERNSIIARSEKLTIDTSVFKINSSGKIVYVVTQAENSGEFLKLFKDINPVNFHFFTSESEGTRIEVNRFKYVNDPEIFTALEGCRDGKPSIFAIGKFDLSHRYIALIIRQQSQYTESRIELLLWDKQLKKISKGTFLADGSGDENWHYDSESWIRSFQFDKEISIMTWTKNFEYSEGFKHKTVSDTVTISQFNGTAFETKPLRKADTVGYSMKWK